MLFLKTHQCILDTYSDYDLEGSMGNKTHLKGEGN